MVSRGIMLLRGSGVFVGLWALQINQRVVHLYCLHTQRSGECFPTCGTQVAHWGRL